jgi:dimethylargininase
MPDHPLALLRSVPDSFAGALVGGAPAARLDPDLARRQHTAYAEALRAGGFAVRILPGDERHPDCPFIEDTAVVIGERALITRPGHPSRRGEVGPVAEALAVYADVSRVPEDARIDGGDVLQAGRTIFVGRSERTDDAGIAALSAFAAPLGRAVVPVPVSGVLHLKSAVTALDDGTLLAASFMAGSPAFEGFEVVVAPGEDPEAANVVRLPDGSLLVAAHHPDTAGLLEGRGLPVATVDVSEFAAADGGLTCLSIRLRSVLAAAAP